MKGLIISIHGSIIHYENNLIHRKNGPAVEYADGGKYWWFNGKPHREDGPACEHCDGNKTWFYHGKKIECSSNEEFLRIIKLKAFW